MFFRHSRPVGPRLLSSLRSTVRVGTVPRVDLLENQLSQLRFSSRASHTHYRYLWISIGALDACVEEELAAVLTEARLAAPWFLVQ